MLTVDVIKSVFMVTEHELSSLVEQGYSDYEITIMRMNELLQEN